MQGTFVSTGNIVDIYTASAVDAGDVLVAGSLALVVCRGVTAAEITAGSKATCYAEGVVDVAKVQAAITLGAPVYWDADGNPYDGEAGTGCATEDNTGNKLMGYCVLAAESTDTTVRIKIANDPINEGS